MQRLPYEVMEPVFKAVGLVLTDAQMEVAKQPDRFPVIGGGERGGKSVVSAAILFPHVLMAPALNPERYSKKADEKKRLPDFVIFGPTYMEPRIEFQYLEDYLRKMGQIEDGINKPSKPQEGPWRLVTKQGVVVATWSMEDPTSIRALDLEGAVVAECGRASYQAVERIQGRVSAKRGFILYSGTMENSHQWYQDWMLMGKRDNHLGIRSYSLPTFSNHHEFPGGRNDPEILRLERVYPEDVFAMRILAEPRPLRVRVLKEFEPHHIKKVTVPKDATIQIWVDPGYASAYAVIFVAIWDEIDKKTKEVKRKLFHVMDEIYVQGLTTTDIIQLCNKHPLWRRVSGGVIDVAGKGHRDAGESALEIWKRKSKITSWNMKYWNEDPLIERIRSCAKQDQITIDPECRGLIAEIGLGEPVFDEMHPWKYFTDRDGKITGEKPVDKWNHSAKALGYGLLQWLGQVETTRHAVPFNRLRKKDTGVNKNSGTRRSFIR